MQLFIIFYKIDMKTHMNRNLSEEETFILSGSDNSQNKAAPKYVSAM